MNINRFKRLPIIGILRDVKLDCIKGLVENIALTGLETIEITMNTDKAPGLIREAVKASGGRLMIGAGTVLNTDELKSALDNGATFIVMPVLIRDVVEYCVKKKIPVFPGALSPGEIYNAWSMGAAMVKVFPVKFFGVQYIKEIRGPFKDIELMACGGVTPENLKDYFNNGASAVTFGASVFKKELLLKKDFKSMNRLIRRFIEAYSYL